MNNMKKLRIPEFIPAGKIAAVSLILLGILLSSCRKKNEDSQDFKPRLATDAKYEIHIAGNYKNFEALEAEFDRFNEFYPDVELSYTSLDKYNSTIRSAILSEDAPDIFMTFPWMLDKSDYQELLSHTENMADEKKLGFNLSTIRSQLISRMEDGSVIMVPVFCGSFGMLVNEDIFKNHGLEVPETYTSLVESCRKLKEAGYKSPIMTFLDSFSGLPMIYSYFCKSLSKVPESIPLLNSLDPSAGEYLKPTLEWIRDFMKLGLIDLEECGTLQNKYNEVIMRFFEGNIPIILCDTDIVSGTLKRESQSLSFINNPFKYSFRMFPTSDEGTDFLNSVAVSFSVNKNSKNIEMANEFMRFLIRTEELNNIAKIKRLITTSKNYSFDQIYSALSNSSPIYLHETGLMDNAIIQMRTAVEQVMLGKMTVDEAAANYGKF